jgi:hypothetical protein
MMLIACIIIAIFVIVLAALRLGLKGAKREEELWPDNPAHRARRGGL